MKSFIHIGLDKCGSSTLQRFFSENAHFHNSQNKSLEYKCLTKNGVLNGNQIKIKSREQTRGYLSSVGLNTLQKFSKKDFNDFKLKNNDDIDLIYSCEGWYRALKEGDLFLDLCTSLEGSIKRELFFIIFLRSPVLWINSAWWQWGAWENNTLDDFESWLETNTLNCCWYKYFSKFKKLPNKYKLIIKPLTKNLISDVQNILNINRSYKSPNIVNKSLPIEVLKFYIENPIFRPSGHENKFDYVFSNLISKSNIESYEVPWILSDEHVRFIINNTRKSSNKLLKLMELEDQKYILNDPSWWDADYYKKMVKYDPYLKDFKLNKNLMKLFSTLLIQNYDQI